MRPVRSGRAPPRVRIDQAYEFEGLYGRQAPAGLFDGLTARAEREGASVEAVLLAFICAAIGVSRKHHLEDRVDLMLALLRAGGITFRDEPQKH